MAFRATFNKATLLLAATALAATAGAAAAQSKRQRAQEQRAPYAAEQPPLTVNKRSFLDPGPVVPVGSMSRYMASETIFARTPDQTAHRSLYGNETLPAPLEVPGRPQPILTWEGPRLSDY